MTEAPHRRDTLPAPPASSSKAGLHIRRVMAEFVPEPDRYQRKPDITPAMTGRTWVKLYLSPAMPEDLIKNGEI
jgi:hypothetical protein